MKGKFSRVHLRSAGTDKFIHHTCNLEKILHGFVEADQLVIVKESLENTKIAIVFALYVLFN